ncbi:hypothetical protein GPJ56_005732 [Histomonas meleagridis]|uniref:uncharacterized protein n=1 Tax=Histomonas meleagridis TaxID=135588 RepID=UPI00355998A6|nr:hypothetical protein GPJ56_005732 [Histomonas meleagridis]KAH0803332.1 hypothetical protein GO595_003676 [Histomonas meleagridis]
MEDFEGVDIETLEAMLLSEQSKTSELEAEYRKLELEVQKLSIHVEQKEENLIALFNKKIKKLKERNAAFSLDIQKEKDLINQAEQQYQASLKQSEKLSQTTSHHENQICPELEAQIAYLQQEIEKVRNCQFKQEEAESKLAKLQSELEERGKICENQLCDFTNEIEELIRYNNNILEQIGQIQKEQETSSSSSEGSTRIPVQVGKKHRQGYSSLPVKRKKRKVHHS